MISVFGVMISFWASLSALMYSEKSRVIDCSWKFIEPFVGLEFINVGGIVSLGPPVGEPGLAHLEKSRSAITTASIATNKFFNSFWLERR